MKRRVAITGLVALAPNGNSTEEMWNSMINGVNGYVVPFDMQNIDAERFLTIPEFEYKWDNEGIIKKWRKVLGNTKKKQDYHPDAVTVRCTRSYFDIGFQRNVQSGEIVTMTLERAKTVCEAGFVEVI